MSNNDIPLAARALAVFHQPPLNLNCAQAVAHAWQAAVGKDDPSQLAALKACGGGRAPGGTCGALHAAQLVLAETGGDPAALSRVFADRHGQVTCQELKRRGVSCATCVATACDLLAPGGT